MLPGKPQILTCPYCGKEKEIMSLLSGNTFGAVLWSDNKQIAPMLPEISFVQKCPHCGKYFIRSRQEVRFSEKGCAFDLGRLSFQETKEAFFQLSNEGFENKQEETRVRIMLHHAYNDYYYRTDINRVATPEDKELFHDNGLWLINNWITDNVMKAEFYREIEEMETARTILESTDVSDDFLKKVASNILDRIEVNDCKVFKINRD